MRALYDCKACKETERARRRRRRRKHRGPPEAPPQPPQCDRTHRIRSGSYKVWVGLFICASIQLIEYDILKFKEKKSAVRR